jgi:DNA helicase IV
MSSHPELADEQAYLDHAFVCLEESRRAVLRLRDLAEGGRGGTHQARYERDVIEDEVRSQLADLELNHQALIFGRIDRHIGEGEGTEAFHIGRLAIADSEREPVVVDWRAPVAEPFYRATGRHPMGLSRRRHFVVNGRTIIDIEDELFGEGHLGIGSERADGLRGYSTLIAALEKSRTGQLSDIVETIQAEQDEIIRAPQSGVLVVQGGPGTGKTVVALHRAAYLLYTHRFPLEDQGVLLIGPNRVFLRYIERVLPSLGEAGVEQLVLADLVPDVSFGGTESQAAARIKGDARMAPLIAKAVRDRERSLKDDLVVPYGTTFLRMRAAHSAEIIGAARRRFRRHNAARKFVEGELFAALAASSRNEESLDTVRERTRLTEPVRVALERMWPLLSPAELLHDLFGSPALLRLAAAGKLSDAELEALHRPRAAEPADVAWTDADAPLLDEARELLGHKPTKKAVDDELRTYGHIVIDEVQDLTPMQLRMAARRSLNGSLTVVGDIAQATGQHAPRTWADVLAHLPDRRPPRITELSVGYRIPGQVMDLAARVLARAVPGLEPPTSVRDGDRGPDIIEASSDDLLAAVASAVQSVQSRLGDASVAVIVPSSLINEVDDALTAAGIVHGMAMRTGLSEQVSVVPVGLVKGLELDASVVVEPARIVAEEAQGLRALYVALTRCTKELTVVHSEPLPF